MHILPPSDMRPLDPLGSRRTRRRRLLRPMLIGSVLVHCLLLGLALWQWPEAEPQPSSQSDEVAMVFENATGSAQSSTASPTPSPNPSVAAGSAAAPVSLPNPDNTPLPSPPPTPTPAQPPTPPAEASPTVPETPPAPQPVTQQPPPHPPPPQPPVPRPPPTVSLSEEEVPLPLPPPFQMPQPPPPLPPLPRPAQPRVARVAPRNPSPLSAPQDWSFNAAPAEPSTGRPSRGFDLSTSPRGGPADSNLGYVSGAKPSGDWMSALSKWVDQRKYYPEQAIAQFEQGTVTLMVNIDRSGRVLSVQLADTSHSQFLDGAFEDLFRHGMVPPFTPDMTEQTTTLRATMHFVLRQR